MTGQPALTPYVPRLLLRHLDETPDAAVRRFDGTLVFIDVSGFTELSERLARQGREGAERLADAIGRCFTDLLTVAYECGGGLLKFGGDALLLLFDGDGHAERGCRAAAGMRSALREAGRLDEGGVRVKLRMSVGVHSGECTFFVTRGDHRELLVTGPAATQVVRMERAAATGQIVVSDDTAARLPAACTRPATGPGRLLRSAPAAAGDPPPQRAWHPPGDRLESALSPLLRAHLQDGAGAPEHRLVTVAFLRFGGVESLLARAGPEAVADALDELVGRTAGAAARHGVCLLGSDVDADGGKLLLTAGAPIASDDDDGRMLLALREILDGRGPLPVKIGVNRGAVFAGDIGPAYRRTYTVMGDAINLAARLMAAAPDGELYATERVLDGSATRFAVTRMAPFRVKGKARPVEAFAVGPATGSRSREALLADRRFPLMGRRRELDALEAALAAVREGGGRVVEIVSEPGIGKSRLLEELRSRAGDLRGLHATCEAYTAAMPHGASRQLLRQVLRVPVDADDELVAARLRTAVRGAAPMLEPWLPLLAIAVGVDLPPTREVAQLDEEFRRTKLHELVVDFLRATLPGPAVIEIEDGHAMDPASAGLLRAVAAAAATSPWLLAITRRDAGTGLLAPAGAHVLRIEPEPLERGRDARAGARGHAERPARRPACSSSPPSGRGAIRSTSATCCGRRPTTPSTCRRASRPPPSRAWTGCRRPTARSCAGPPCSAAPSTRRSCRSSSTTTCPRPTPRRGPGCTATSSPTASGTCGSAASSCGRRPTRAFRSGPAAGCISVRASSSNDASATRPPPCSRCTSIARAITSARGATPGAPATPRCAGSLPPRARRPTGAPWRPAASSVRRRRTGRSCGRRSATPTPSSASSRSGTTPSRRPGGWRPPIPSARRSSSCATRSSRWRRAGSGRASGGRCEGSAPSTAPTDARRAAPPRARLTAMLATLRQRQGRAAEAIALCESAIGAAEATGEERAVAHACYVLDWALVESGRASEAGHSERALEIYRRLGDVGREAAVLNNAGGFAYRDGRWNDAMTLYLEGAEASARSGNAANAAFGDCNVGELLSDQGHWDEGGVAAAPRTAGVAGDGLRVGRRLRHRTARAPLRPRRAGGAGLHAPRRRAGALPRARRGGRRAVRGRAARRGRRLRG